MKKILTFSLLVFSFLIFNPAHSQSFFSFKGGYSMPLGQYASNNLDNGCFTYSGITFGVDGAWFFYKNIGMGADLSYSLHSVDASALATAKVYSDPFLSDLTVRSDPYTLITSVAGLYYHLKINEKMSLEPKFLAGVMFAKTPYQLYEPEFFMVGPSYYKITSSNDRSFAYKTGLTFKYQLSNCMIIGVHAEYTHPEMAFGFNSFQGMTYNYRNISFLDLGIGLVYTL